MVITRMPFELLEGLPIVFIVGFLIGLAWVHLSNKFKDKSWGLVNKMSSVVFVVLMGVGVIGSFSFNIYQRNVEDERVQDYIVETTTNIKDKLTTASEDSDFEEIYTDLYDAEYEVVKRRSTNVTHTIPIGEMIVNGEDTTVSKYITSLTTDDREDLLGTDKSSLKNFTTLDFAKLDTEISNESLKLGGFGREKMRAVVTNQRETLNRRVGDLDFSKESFSKVITDALIISVAFMIVSVIIAVLINLTIKDFLSEIGLRRLAYEGKEESKDTYEEYDLVDGELEDPVYVTKEEELADKDEQEEEGTQED